MSSLTLGYAVCRARNVHPVDEKCQSRRYQNCYKKNLVVQCSAVPCRAVPWGCPTRLLLLSHSSIDWMRHRLSVLLTKVCNLYAAGLTTVRGSRPYSPRPLFSTERPKIHTYGADVGSLSRVDCVDCEQKMAVICFWSSESTGP